MPWGGGILPCPVFPSRADYRARLIHSDSPDRDQQRNNPGWVIEERQQRLWAKIGREWPRTVACGCLARPGRRDGAKEEPDRNLLPELAFPRKKPTWLASALSLNPGVAFVRFPGFKLRGQDSNLRPRGYEPRELPGCSTPQGNCNALKIQVEPKPVFFCSACKCDPCR